MTIYGVDVTPILTSVLEVLVGILVTVVTVKFIPWIRSKVNQKQMAMILEFVELSVRAAEQIFEANQGPEKLAYAKELVKEALLEKGIVISDDVLRGYIESAVYELHKAFYSSEI